MTGIRETPCTHCIHREVCSFKDEFLSAMKAVNEVSVSLPSKETSVGCCISLRDIKWIKPVELVCTYYYKDVLQTREAQS